jgi:outer membrane protein OmpA-like peptidoglycan-associated protein
MMHARKWLTLTALAALLFVRTASANEFEEKRFYLTPFVGATIFDSERKLLTGEDLPNDMYFGGRAGVRLNHLLWGELAGGYTSVNVCDCDWVDWTHISGNLMLSPASLRTVNPFISVGGGWSNFTHVDGTGEKLGTFEGAGGLRVRLNDVLGLRLEARDVLALPSSSWGKAHLNDIVLGAGLTFGFGGAGKAKEIDSDGDGVYDGSDNCPNTPHGCRVDEHGCPIDSDGDGVCDGLDQCPNTLAGCKVDEHGCPLDSDHDGVCDGLDQCPNTRPGATVDRVGCEIEVVPPEIKEKETELLDTGKLVISDINFDFDKSTIRPSSYHTLDIVGQVLTKWPGLRIEIGGHTDSRGSDKYNMALSHRRAESVRAYLLAHFPQFTPSQLTARGFGESAPLVPNNSEAHMQMNRRVEFTVLNKEMLKRDK